MIVVIRENNGDTVMAFSKLHPVALGLSVGVISGLSTLFMGFLAVAFYTGKPLVAMVGTMYVTFNPSFINAALGAVIVFVNGFIGSYIAAWIYNLLIKHFHDRGM